MSKSEVDEIRPGRYRHYKGNEYEESLIIVTLLHDICKTRFYGVEMKNKKIDGQWESVPSYIIEDQLPLGHGEKSVYMISSMMHLTLPETMMIRWHMGMPDAYIEKGTFGTAVEKFPMIWALHTADMQAAHFMESESGNRELFKESTDSAIELPRIRGKIS